jgi:hypothetical protein
MGVGSMFTIGIGVFVMWLLADRRPILALLSAVCVGAAAVVAVAAAPHIGYGGGVASLAPYRLILVCIVTSLLIAVGALHLFPEWRKRWLVLPFLMETAVAFLQSSAPFNVLTRPLWRVSFVALLILAAWGIWRKRSGAWLLLGGTTMTLAWHEHNPQHFEHTGFMVGFLPILVAMIAAIALRLRAERLQARDTRLLAARMEIELLKKSLQPHFLMNTLTALSQVIEEKPAAAVRLIDDLAVEFRSLARFSAEKSVLIGEELALCRAHLGVMSARTDRAWKLEAAGIDATASIPPALFLTLIENGFSHQRARLDETTFTLRAERTGERVRYIFYSPGTVTPEGERVVGGTGLRYICARLEESFQGAWKLTQGAVPGGWETVIDLLHTSSAEVAP